MTQNNLLSGLPLVHFRRAAGIDVHRNSFVCCILDLVDTETQVVAEGTFETFFPDLDKIADWLAKYNPGIITMESTGIYWESLAYRLQDRGMPVNVVNPAHVKGLRGKKTDKKDAAWLASISFLSTTNCSFIPTAPFRELRHIERYRDNLVRDLQRLKNRLHKQLDRVCIKLTTVFSDMSGKNARRAMQGVIDGLSPEQIVDKLNLKRLKADRETIIKALSGVVSDTTRDIISSSLAMIKDVEAQIAQRTEEMIAGVSRLCPAVFCNLKAVPGLSDVTAAGILIEIGGDVSAFPSVKQFTSWLGICPGDHESAGKRMSGKIRKGNKYVRRYLVQAAHAAIRTKCSLGSKCRVLCSKLGKKKGIVASAHKLSRILYAMIKNVAEYRDPQIDHEQVRVCKKASSNLQRIVDATGMSISTYNSHTGEVVMTLTPMVPLQKRTKREREVITQSLQLPGVAEQALLI